MYVVKKVVGSVGTLYYVMHAYTYNSHGMFTDLASAYLHAKKLNRGENG